MLAADELQAQSLPELVNALRDTVDTFRYRWLSLPIGGSGATLRGRWTALGLSMLVVFACFFALGRHMASSTASSGGAPAELEGAAGQATIPAELSGGSPSAGAVPVAIVARPRPAPRTPRQGLTRRLPVEVPSPAAAVAQPQVAEAAAPGPARATAPTVAPAPSASATPGAGSSASEISAAPAPSQHAGGRSGTTAGRSGGAAGAAAGAPLPGGSFDTSE